MTTQSPRGADLLVRGWPSWPAFGRRPMRASAADQGVRNTSAPAAPGGINSLDRLFRPRFLARSTISRGRRSVGEQALEFRTSYEALVGRAGSQDLDPRAVARRSL